MTLYVRKSFIVKGSQSIFTSELAPMRGPAVARSHVMRFVVSVSISLIIFTSTACSGGETTATTDSETDGVSTTQTEEDVSESEAQDDGDASTSTNVAPDVDEGTAQQEDSLSSADDGSVVTDDVPTGPGIDDVDDASSLDTSVGADTTEPVDAAGPNKLDTSGSEPDTLTENQPPVAVDDSATTEADEPVKITVLANDSDVDGDKLEIIAVTQGINGMVEVIEGIGPAYDAVEYTPLNPSFTGTDSFTYTISDGQGHEATATVIINIVEPAPAPVLTIISPEHGEIITGDTATIVFEVTGCNFVPPSADSLGCHGHKFLDGNKYTASYGHYSTLPFDIGPLTQMTDPTNRGNHP
jgi:hypothetical protein